MSSSSNKVSFSLEHGWKRPRPDDDFGAETTETTIIYPGFIGKPWYKQNRKRVVYFELDDPNWDKDID